ncbi:efflux pump antibiotic resistance protein [Talaromyces pinophilus]|uniref:Efflux pump antibiotic resistance protein n=1 Tax=Talaromyces pinophilus TaxID=128442 RepID=A0A510NWK5_TALPI|nr:efflux pump antibiotic resistance protein [Talaromyces pinophilus]
MESSTITSTAIPKITDHFRALDDIGCYASAYLLTNCTLQLPLGKLYTFHPIKWTYITAVFLFEKGTLISHSHRRSCYRRCPGWRRRYQLIPTDSSLCASA